MKHFRLMHIVLSCLLTVVAPASVHAATPKPAAKPPQCVAARGQQPVKIESRCKYLPLAELTRTYRVYAPKSTKPMSVLLVLHGGGGSGSAMEGLTLAQFNRIADKHGVLVVYPDGVDRGWNDGRDDPRVSAQQRGIDDVGFMRALVSRLAEQYRVDRRRVYATGISNGGLMSFRLACDAPELVAAVAVVAANMSVELARDCKPARGMPLAIINGTDDPMMPWLGGEISVLGSRRGEVLSAQQSFEHWADAGECALPNTHMARDGNPKDGTSLVRHVARDCKDRAEVRLYEILGGGHTWPGGHPYLGVRVVGKVSAELRATDEIWSFVSRFALPSR